MRNKPNGNDPAMTALPCALQGNAANAGFGEFELLLQWEYGDAE